MRRCPACCARGSKALTAASDSAFVEAACCSAACLAVRSCNRARSIAGVCQLSCDGTDARYHGPPSRSSAFSNIQDIQSAFQGVGIVAISLAIAGLWLPPKPHCCQQKPVGRHEARLCSDAPCCHHQQAVHHKIGPCCAGQNLQQLLIGIVPRQQRPRACAVPAILLLVATTSLSVRMLH